MLIYIYTWDRYSCTYMTCITSYSYTKITIIYGIPYICTLYMSRCLTIYISINIINTNKRHDYYQRCHHIWLYLLIETHERFIIIKGVITSYPTHLTLLSLLEQPLPPQRHCLIKSEHGREREILWPSQELLAKAAADGERVHFPQGCRPWEAIHAPGLKMVPHTRIQDGLSMY